MGAVKIIKERTIKKWWQRIEAVKDGRVYVISSEIYTGPRAQGGVDCFAKWLYPQRKH